jgi:hypothetical protein
VELINLNQQVGSVRSFQAPDTIDAILVLERAIGFQNNLMPTLDQALKIFGGKEAMCSVLALITNHVKS